MRPQQSLHWHLPPNFITGVATFGGNDQALQRQLTIDATAELLPVFDFVLTCDRLGLQVPVPDLPADPSAHPDWMIGKGDPLVGDDFTRFSDIPMELALAQQHGLPTRLLDWTFDPVAAAFFAVEALTGLQPSDIAVWALHRTIAETVTCDGVMFPNGPGGGPLEIRPGIAIVRPSIRDNPYLAAQSGLFTTIRAPGIYFMQSGGKRPSLEEVLARTNIQGIVLRKLILPREEVAPLALILEREQVSRSRLMPTLDNAAADISRRWIDAAEN